MSVGAIVDVAAAVPEPLLSSRLLKNVMSESETRQNATKKRSICFIFEHFEEHFNKVSLSVIVFQHPARLIFVPLMSAHRTTGDMKRNPMKTDTTHFLFSIAVFLPFLTGGSLPVGYAVSKLPFLERNNESHR